MKKTTIKTPDGKNEEKKDLLPELKSKKIWVNWKFELNKDSKKTKVPYHPTNYKASSTDEKTWSTFKEVTSAMDSGSTFDGIGFMFDKTSIGIDLDKVWVDGKIVDERSQKLISTWNSYIEFSPSDTGFHLLAGLSNFFELKRKSNNTGLKNALGEIKYEVYNTARFFTFTGKNYNNLPFRLMEEKEVIEMLQILGYPWAKKTDSILMAPINNTQNISNQKVIDKLLTNKKYKKLYNLDDSDKEDDKSVADMSFMSGIRFYVGDDRQKMKEIFMASPRGAREKVSVRKDYIERLLDDCLAFPCSDYYKWNKKQESKEKPKFTSISELLNEPDEETLWVVDNLLPSEGFSIKVSKPKVGKSTLVRQLCVAVAKGVPFLGRATKQGSVIYLAIEEKRQEVKNHFRLLGAEGLNNISIFVGRAPESALEWLKEEVTRTKPNLIVIDTLFRFVKVEDVNAYASVTNALDDLLELARTSGAHLMVLHHSKKGLGGEGGEVALGSQAIFGSVDTVIMLSKKEGRRYIETEQRYGKNLESTILEFDDNTKTVTLGRTQAEDKIITIEKKIIEHLETVQSWLTEQEILNTLGCKTETFRDALRLLYYKQEIKRSGEGKKGSPYKYACSHVPDIYKEQESVNDKLNLNNTADESVTVLNEVDKKDYENPEGESLDL